MRPSGRGAKRKRGLDNLRGCGAPVTWWDESSTARMAIGCAGEWCVVLGRALARLHLGVELVDQVRERGEVIRKVHPVFDRLVLVEEVCAALLLHHPHDAIQVDAGKEAGELVDRRLT